MAELRTKLVTVSISVTDGLRQSKQNTASVDED